VTIKRAIDETRGNAQGGHNSDALMAEPSACDSIVKKLSVKYPRPDKDFEGGSGDYIFTSPVTDAPMPVTTVTTPTPSTYVNNLPEPERMDDGS
jgi:hypothetical protein